jgi:hypothetical protein
MRLLGFFSKIRIKLSHTLRANAVGEFGFRMPDKIMLNRVPIFLIVSDALAV